MNPEPSGRGPSTEPEHRSVWPWVLARWRPIAAVVVATALAGFLMSARGAPRYVARAVVVASESETGVAAEDFGGLADALLATDTVLQPVIDELGLDTTPAELRESDQVQTESLSSSLAVRIVGRASDPDLAADLARVAAESLASAAQARGLGTFAVFPGSTDEPLSPAAWAITGAGVGALASLIGLMVFASIRQPMLGLDDLRHEASTDAGFVVRLRGGRRNRTHRRLYPHGVLEAIARAATAEGRSAALVLVERRRAGDPGLRWVAGALASELLAGGPHHDVPLFRIHRGELEPLEDDRPEALRVTGGVVALVSEGAPRDAVRAYEEALLALGSPLQRRVVVLVTSARGRGAAVLPARAALPAHASGGGELAATAEPVVQEAPPVPREAPAAASIPAPAEPPAAPSREEPSPAPDAEPGQEEPDQDLLQALGDPDAGVRAEALRRVMAEPQPGAMDAVRTLLRDPDAEVRGLAVSAIATMAAVRPR